MNHSFDVDIAVKYGVNAAILLQNISWWIQKNKANQRHFHDGYYWTYNSRSAFTEMFPYLSERQIKTAMDKLIEDGIIITGDYNTDKWKKPTWYAITEKGWSIIQNRYVDDTKMSDRDDENVRSYTDISTDKKKKIYISRDKSDDEALSGFDEFWSAYPHKVAVSTAKKAWKKLKPDNALLQAILKDLQQRKDGIWKDKDKQYIPHPTTYLNQRRWEDELDTNEEPIQRDLDVDEIRRRYMGL